jgi:tRNA 2-thiouridine synthesizing protein A
LDVNLVVDARFKSCPGPVLALAEAVSRAKPGQIVKLLATDPAAPLDIKEWASSIGHKVLEIKKANGVSEIYVEVSG